LIVSDAIIAALGYEADAAVPLGIVAVGVGVDLQAHPVHRALDQIRPRFLCRQARRSQRRHVAAGPAAKADRTGRRIGRLEAMNWQERLIQRYRS
jgi:hypothetical protein